MLSAVKKSSKILFLKRFIKSPSTIGSITPSSIFLTKSMVKLRDIRECKNIVELGGGTGIFTQRIINIKPPQCNFYIFEKDPELKKHLHLRFLEHKIFSEAADIKKLCNDGCIDNPDVVISGLPFAVFDPELCEKILSGIYDVLPVGGKFITFQYSLNQYDRLKKMYSSVKLEFIPFNIPPAIVYTCTK